MHLKSDAFPVSTVNLGLFLVLFFHFASFNVLTSNLIKLRYSYFGICFENTVILGVYFCILLPYDHKCMLILIIMYFVNHFAIWPFWILTTHWCCLDCNQSPLPHLIVQIVLRLVFISVHCHVKFSSIPFSFKLTSLWPCWYFCRFVPKLVNGSGHTFANQRH